MCKREDIKKLLLVSLNSMYVCVCVLERGYGTTCMYQLLSSNSTQFSCYSLETRGLANLMHVVHPSLNPDTEETSSCTSGQAPL